MSDLAATVRQHLLGLFSGAGQCRGLRSKANDRDLLLCRDAVLLERTRRQFGNARHDRSEGDDLVTLNCHSLSPPICSYRPPSSFPLQSSYEQPAEVSVLATF